MEPILIAHLLPKLDVLLLELLKQLKPMEWEAQTLAPKWKVKDVATHLLDGNLRSLSMLRDNYFGESMEGSHSYENLVVFLNGLNSDWVKATRRLSPSVIISLLEWSGEPYCQHLQSLDPFGKAVFSGGLGRGNSLKKLVSYSPGVYRKMAPPTANSDSDRTSSRNAVNG